LKFERNDPMKISALALALAAIVLFHYATKSPGGSAGFDFFRISEPMSGGQLPEGL
jgi:hypothetical protein